LIRTVTRDGAESRTEEQLPTDDAVLAAYREHFGVVLDRVPTLMAGPQPS
jgi:N-hydroxyarylamine O-acetyltransferase